MCFNCFNSTQYGSLIGCPGRRQSSIEFQTFFKKTLPLVNHGFTKATISICGSYLIHYGLSRYSLLDEDFNQGTQFILLRVCSSFPDLFLYRSIINQRMTEMLNLTYMKERTFDTDGIKKVGTSKSLLRYSVQFWTSSRRKSKLTSLF